MSPIFKCLICRKDIERSTKTFWSKKGHLLCSTCLDNIDKKKLWIIKFRKDLIENNNDQWNYIKSSPDFYTVSGVRDLLFHVQEHQFTISKIKKYLEKKIGLNLKKKSVLIPFSSSKAIFSQSLILDFFLIIW